MGSLARHGHVPKELRARVERAMEESTERNHLLQNFQDGIIFLFLEYTYLGPACFLGLVRYYSSISARYVHIYT